MGKQYPEIVNISGQLYRISDHQRNKSKSRQDTLSQQRDSRKESKCGNCGRDDHSSKLNDWRNICPAFDKTCSKCQTNGHFANMCRGGPRNTRERSKSTHQKPKINEVKTSDRNSKESKDTSKDNDADLGTLSGSWMLVNGHNMSHQGDKIYEVTDEFSSVRHWANPDSQSATLLSIKQREEIRKLRHHMRDSFGKWTPSHVQPHGRVPLTVKICQSASHQLDLPPVQGTVSTNVSALADTGTQMCIAHWQIAKKMRLRRKDLLVPALTISVADDSNLELIGAHFLSISSTSGDTTYQLVYFATGVGEFYLSKSAMIYLKIIPHDFSRVGSCVSKVNAITSDQHLSSLEGDVYVQEVQDEFTSNILQGVIGSTPFSSSWCAPTL